MANTIEMVIKASDKASSELRKVSGEVSKLGDEAGKAGKGGVSSLGASITTMGASVLGAVGVLGGFAVAAKKAFDFAEEGAQIAQTEESFNSLMEQVGAAPDLLDRLSQASNGTISDFDLMASTLRLVAGAQGDLAKAMADAAPRLLEIAKAANKLNPSLGSTAFLYESLMTGIKRGSPLIIDNTGLTLKLGEANERYAASLGKSVDELTAEEQKMALLTATMKAGDAMLQQVGGNTDSAADAFARLKVALEEAGNAAKQQFAPGMANAAEAAVLLLTWNQQLAGALGENADVLAETAGSYDEYIQATDEAARQAGMFYDAEGNLISRSSGLVEANARLTQGMFELRDGIYTVVNPMDAVRDAMAGVQLGAENASGVLINAAGGFDMVDRSASNAARATAESAAAMEVAREAAASLASDLGNLDFSTQAMWKQVEQLAGSTDLGDAAVRRLAVGMGLVTEADLRAYDARNQLLTAMAEGAEVTGALLLVTQDLSTYETEAAAAAQEAARGNAELAAQHQAAADSALRQAEKIVELTTKTDALSNAYGRVPPSVETKIEQPGMGPAMSAAQNYKAILDAIPAEKRTRIIQEYVTTRGGSPIAGGGDDAPEYQAGTNYVPFTGPAILHQGEMVIPPAQAANMRSGGGMSTLVIAPVLLDAGAYTDATGAMNYADIGSLVLQRLEGVM